MPLLGMAIGGATGAAAGAATDVGVDDNFMKELGEKLQPGGAAVFVLVSQSTPDTSSGVGLAARGRPYDCHYQPPTVSRPHPLRVTGDHPLRRMQRGAGAP
jgi:hypothetical protein